MVCPENRPQEEKVGLKCHGEDYTLDLASGGHQTGGVRSCFGSTAQTSVEERTQGGETQPGGWLSPCESLVGGDEDRSSAGVSADALW